MRMLIINSYAGSITIAAHQLGLEVVGSYEDCGYGLDVQSENFPHLNYVPQEPWPAQDLSNTLVFAHPPCSAFSVQTPLPQDQRGLKSEAFKCTVAVMRYAFEHKALLLAVESVVPALEGARTVHDEIAKEYGYSVFRVLQNARSFGVAQHRPRFWVLFTRALPQLILKLQPKSQTILDVISQTTDPYEVCPLMDQETMKQEAKLLDHFGEEMAGDLLHDGVAGLLPAKIVHRFGDLSLKEATYQYCLPGWLSSQLRVLDVLQPATTLLGNTWWYVRTDENRGRILTISEYNQVMGFPRDYKFPIKMRSGWRNFLSRGVCPPVAKWLMEQVLQNLDQSCFQEPLPGSVVRVVGPGEVANFNP